MASADKLHYGPLLVQVAVDFTKYPVVRCAMVHLAAMRSLYSGSSLIRTLFVICFGCAGD